MDLQLLGLIALVIAAMIVSTRYHRRGWPGQPGWQFQRVFSVGIPGLVLIVAGLIGWDLQYVRGWFQGTTWANEPIWWQVRLGAALLLLAIFWARRVPYPTTSARR